jgi:glyoxylase-like metal-dependent hydrolase (beta-lactamase superfamily II)
MPESLSYPLAAPPPAGDALEVAPGVLWVRMPLPFALDHINLWLLREGERYTAVDAGYGDAPTRALWERHFERTLRSRPLDGVVATHYHPDHLGNADWLARRFGLTVSMTAAEYLTAHAIHAQTSGYAIADTSALFRAHGVTDDHLDALAGRGNRYRAGVPELPFAFDRLLPGTRVRLAGSDWQVIGGYGHSPEHAALHSADRRLLISGDMLLPRISTNVSVWPSEPYADPVGRFLASLAAFEALPADTLVLPSHGLPFRGIAARVQALREHHAARLAELVDAVARRAGPVSAAELVPVLFPRELDLQQRFFAIGETIAHLNHLATTGRLRRVAEPGAVRFAA